MKINFLPLSRPFSGTTWTFISLFSMGCFLLYGIFFGLSLPLYFLVLAICAICIFYYPEAGLYTIIIMTMWFERNFTLQPLQIGFEIYKIYPLDIIILLTGISIFFRFLIGKLTWKMQKLDWAILIFILVCTLGYVISFFKTIDPAVAFGTYKNYALYAIIYLLISALVVSKKDWQELMFWFSIGGIGLFFFLFYGIIMGQGLWSEITPLSTYGSRLIAGTHTFYLILFGFWLMSGYLWPEENKSKQKINYWQIIGLILVGLGIVVSLVRHLWAALAVIFVVWLIILTKEKRNELLKLAGKVFLVVGTLFIFYVWLFSLFGGNIFDSLSKPFYVLQQRAGVSNLVNLEDSSFGWRVAAWYGGLSTWSHSPIWGTGLGQNISFYVGAIPFDTEARNLHNNYLAILVQLGLLGIGAVVYWFWYVLKKLNELRIVYFNSVVPLLGGPQGVLNLQSTNTPPAPPSIRQRTDSSFGERGEGLTNLFQSRLLFSWGSTIILFMLVFAGSVYWDMNSFVIWWWVALSAIRWLSIVES